MARYGVTLRVIRHYGTRALARMTEDARAIVFCVQRAQAEHVRTGTVWRLRRGARIGDLVPGPRERRRAADRNFAQQQRAAWAERKRLALREEAKTARRAEDETVGPVRRMMELAAKVKVA